MAEFVVAVHRNLTEHKIRLWWAARRADRATECGRREA
jgi:hypothetical protein